MNIGVIGCGVIGERRVQNLPPSAKLVAVFDPNMERAKKLATYGQNVTICKNAEEFYHHKGLQGVIAAGINSALVPIIQACRHHKLPVLVEKPAARSYKELQSVQPHSQDLIKVGFNHRFHPAYIDIQTEIASRPNDPIMFIRANYGNGARLGFEKEWRANVELSGGGELLDQGVHVLDLASGLLPHLEVKSGWVRTHFWNMSVDDNAWAILSTPKGQTFSMHVSSSEWKNDFRFEVYTAERKYQWTGLGRSYGPEKLTIYQMTPEMGPPKTTERNYPPEDTSWLLENTNFLEAIAGKTKVNGGYQDALTVLKLVEDIYESSKGLNHGTFRHPEWWR